MTIVIWSPLLEGMQYGDRAVEWTGKRLEEQTYEMVVAESVDAILSKWTGIAVGVGVVGLALLIYAVRRTRQR